MSEASAARRPRVIVFACGNASRGDDALGPLLGERIERWIEAHPDAEIACIQDYQLQIEHALDLEGQDLALFIDATVSGPAPFSFERIAPGPDPTWTSHALSPRAVLDVCTRIRGHQPPASFVLAVRGHGFELGAALGDAAAAHLEAAWSLVVRLLADPSEAAWAEVGSSVGSVSPT